MMAETLLRAAAVLVPAVLGALLLDTLCAARGLLPPGFRIPWRRALASLTVTLLLAVAVFSPLGSLGMKSRAEDLSSISTPQLFLLHVLMVITMGVWFLLGFAGVRAEPIPEAEAVALPLEPDAAFPTPPPPRVPLGRQFMAQFGYLTPSIPREVGLGVALGIGAWLAVIVALMVIAGVVWALGGQDAVPKSPPALIPLIAGLPVWVRFLVSLSAGVVEESFFRGFLQPRIGILASTAFFVLAHLSYGQPFMLVGIALLSLIYAFLVKWRQNIWPAMAAHALFDGVQLLVVVPAALRMLGAEKGAAFLW
jgi:membrane protease YdiL (CAAX protease family)